MPKPTFIVLGGGKKYEGGITLFLSVSCSFAAIGGFIFGYDVGISGGVTSMKYFLIKFFPSVYHKMKHEHENQYCKFDSHLLTLFTSSLYIAALISSLFASFVTRSSGRKATMFFGGLLFLTGSILSGTAANFLMLILGRLLLGAGIGFVNQVVPMYLSEMAPAEYRGAIGIGFQMAVTTGILVAGILNYFMGRIKGDMGWRISLTFISIPATILTIASLFLPETPNSIIERGQSELAKQMLRKIRGTNNVEKEFQDLVNACDASKGVQHPWTNIRLPRYRPQLIFCILIPFFQQLTGVNLVMFYAPILFKTLGFGDRASLITAVMAGAVNLFATIVSVYSVDRFGRRALFIEGGKHMGNCLVAAGIMIAWKFGLSGEGKLTKLDANVILFLICAYVAAFAWSWGPLGWLVPSEICPLEIRAAGQSITVSVNMFFTFIVAQSFLSMLCHMKFGIFFFFAGFVLIMTVFIHHFLPETKNVPIEEIEGVWMEHWFWTRYISNDSLDSNDAIFSRRET